MAIRNNESNICSCVLFRIGVFISLSWENVRSTSAVCIGITVQILAKILLLGKILIPVQLVQRSRITSLNFIVLQLSCKNCR